jgi:hypothetical protein
MRRQRDMGLQRSINLLVSLSDNCVVRSFGLAEPVFTYYDDRQDVLNVSITTRSMKISIRFLSLCLVVRRIADILPLVERDLNESLHDEELSPESLIVIGLSGLLAEVETGE